MIHKLFQIQIYNSFILNYVLINTILNDFMWFSRNSSDQKFRERVVSLKLGKHFSECLCVLSCIHCVKCKALADGN